MDGGEHIEKALGERSRFEPLHLALSPSHDLMRVLGPIIHPEPLLMAAGQMEIPEGGAVGPQLVGHNQPGREALLSEKFAHQLQGSPPVSPRLDQDIEDLALVIDSAPRRRSQPSHPDATGRAGGADAAAACRPVGPQRVQRGGEAASGVMSLQG